MILRLVKGRYMGPPSHRLIGRVLGHDPTPAGSDVGGEHFQGIIQLHIESALQFLPNKVGGSEHAEKRLNFEPASSNGCRMFQQHAHAAQFM